MDHKMAERGHHQSSPSRGCPVRAEQALPRRRHPREHRTQGV